jgi:hypothetical protein
VSIELEAIVYIINPKIAHEVNKIVLFFLDDEAIIE